MLSIIRGLLAKSIEDIDSGNSNISEESQMKIIEIAKEVSGNKRLSKYQAYTYLNMSRASFDNYVRAGKLPKGKKEAGFKELFWDLKDLDKFKNERNKRNNSALHSNA